MSELDKIYGDGFISPIEIDDEKTDTHRPSDEDDTPNSSSDIDTNEKDDDDNNEEDEESEEEDEHIEDYGNSDYWDDRYLNETDQFDWLVEYKDLEKENLISDIIYPTDLILILGCAFSEEMYNHDFHYIINIDLSKVVLDQMREKNKDKPEMKYVQMDVTQLLFPDESFNVIIDKSTMDCLLCCVDSDNKIHSMLKESYRCLKPSGIYYCITLHEKEKMLEFFEQPDLPWGNPIQDGKLEVKDIHFIT